MHFVNCERIPQQKDALFVLFCSFIFFDRSDKIFTFLKTCLRTPETFKHQIMRLSSAQFGLVMCCHFFHMLKIDGEEFVCCLFPLRLNHLIFFPIQL